MAELDRAAISIRIAQAREEAGLTQPELAELMEPPVHMRSVQDWESPRNDTVPFRRLDQIARATRVTKEWLLHGDDPATLTLAERLALLIDRLEKVAKRLEERLGPPQAESQ